MGSGNTVFEVLEKATQSPNLRDINYVVEKGDDEYYEKKYGPSMLEEGEIYDGYFNYPKAHGVEIRRELSAKGNPIPDTFMEVSESTITWDEKYFGGYIKSGKKYLTFLDKAPCTNDEYNRSVFEDNAEVVPTSSYDEPLVSDPDLELDSFVNNQVSTCEDVRPLNKVCFPNGYREGWSLSDLPEFIEGKLGRNVQTQVNNIVYQAAQVYEDWLSGISEDDYNIIKQVEYDKEGGAEKSTVLRFEDKNVVKADEDYREWHLANDYATWCANAKARGPLTLWGASNCIEAAERIQWVGKPEPHYPNEISAVSIVDKGEDEKTDGFYGEFGNSYNSRIDINVRSPYTEGVLALFDGYWEDAYPTEAKYFTPDYPSKRLVFTGSRFEKGDPLFEYKTSSGETRMVRAEYSGKVTYHSSVDGGRWMLEVEVDRPEPWYSGIASFFSPEEPEQSETRADEENTFFGSGAQ